MPVLVCVLGLLVGFVSGLVGIGGGILMAPLLLFVPPLFGFAPLSMHTVAGVTIVQGLAACLAGAVVHKRFKAVSLELALWMGGVIFVAAAAGGAVSVLAPNRLLLALFALLAVAAAVLICCPVKEEEEHPDAAAIVFSRVRAVSAAAGVGLAGGMVGQGGSFILIPLMIKFVGIPSRVAIGSNLAIVFMSTLAAFAGKAATGQIDWRLALPVALTVPLAAWLGGMVSHRLPVAALRRVLAFFIVLAAIRICWTLFAA